MDFSQLFFMFVIGIIILIAVKYFYVRAKPYGGLADTQKVTPSPGYPLLYDPELGGTYEVISRRDYADGYFDLTLQSKHEKRVRRYYPWQIAYRGGNDAIKFHVAPSGPTAFIALNGHVANNQEGKRIYKANWEILVQELKIKDEQLKLTERELNDIKVLFNDKLTEELDRLLPKVGYSPQYLGEGKKQQ